MRHHGQEGQVRLELAEPAAHVLYDAHRAGDAHEDLCQLVQSAFPVAHLPLNLLSVELEQRTFHVRGVGTVEAESRRPQREVWLKRFGRLAKEWPFGTIPPEELLARLVERGALGAAVEGLLQVHDSRGLRLDLVAAR
eukprot:scaffold6363_cov25-Tisochrysis_lutea.AAC.1